MNGLCEFLKTSYTCYQAVNNAAAFLNLAGFLPLGENERWKLEEGGKYYVIRSGSIAAFRYHREGGFQIVAAHTDSPCFKLKASPLLPDKNYCRLNVEPYGGGLWYTFFDRPLRIAGRVVRETEGGLAAQPYVGGTAVIPSLAIHMDRGANEKFAPDLQTELPLWSQESAPVPADVKAFDLFLVPDEDQFFSGAQGEYLSSPRLDDLVGSYAALRALAQGGEKQTAVAVLFDSEEIGSRTRQGAGGNLLASTLRRIALAQGKDETDFLCSLAASIMLSLDNAHALHPNHPEKCDPTNRPVLGGGIAVKGHAGGAYTTDALTAALVTKVFGDAGVKYQSFYNRSDMRSGSTLGAISLGQACIPSADIGLAQLAMHSAVETMACADFETLLDGLSAFYKKKIAVCGDTVRIS